MNGAVEEAVAALYGAFIEAGIAPRVSLPPERVARSLDRAALSDQEQRQLLPKAGLMDGFFYGAMRRAEEGVL